MFNRLDTNDRNSTKQIHTFDASYYFQLGIGVRTIDTELNADESVFSVRSDKPWHVDFNYVAGNPPDRTADVTKPSDVWLPNPVITPRTDLDVVPSVKILTSYLHVEVGQPPSN
jgi:spore maturation protein CgeB